MKKLFTLLSLFLLVGCNTDYFDPPSSYSFQNVTYPANNLRVGEGSIQVPFISLDCKSNKDTFYPLSHCGRLPDNITHYSPAGSLDLKNKEGDVLRSYYQIGKTTPSHSVIQKCGPDRIKIQNDCDYGLRLSIELSEPSELRLMLSIESKVSIEFNGQIETLDRSVSGVILPFGHSGPAEIEIVGKVKLRDLAILDLKESIANNTLEKEVNCVN